MSKDNINPDHYKKETSLECIETMEIIFGTDAVVHFCACNAWKYIWRWKNKNGIEDLNKATWYINHAKKVLENEYDISDQGANGFYSILDRMAVYICDEIHSRRSANNEVSD